MLIALMALPIMVACGGDDEEEPLVDLSPEYRKRIIGSWKEAGSACDYPVYTFREDNTLLREGYWRLVDGSYICTRSSEGKYFIFKDNVFNNTQLYWIHISYLYTDDNEGDFELEFDDNYRKLILRWKDIFLKQHEGVYEKIEK